MRKRSIITLLLLAIVVAPLNLGYTNGKQATTVVTPSLVISPALTSIPSDGGSHPALFITLTKNGAPYLILEPLNVTLSCSDDRVLTIPKWVSIAKGRYYAIVNASSDVQEKKSVEVSASTSDFTSSKVIIYTEPPTGTPNALKVTLLPDTLEPRVGATSEIIVTIIDPYGKPAKARADITITLSSSNLRYVDVTPKSIKIPEGDYSAKAFITSNGYIGTAIISASTSDLKPDSATAKISGAKPEKLSFWAPSKLLVNDNVLAFLGIVDNAMKPAKTPVPMSINLYSSNNSIVTVTNTKTVTAGDWVTFANIVAVAPGTATIYAASEGLISATISINVWGQSGSVATALKVYPLTGFFPADEKKSTVLAVQLVDAKGLPVANTSKTVSIFSTSSSILDTQDTISVGGTSSVSYVSATPKLAGTVKVTALSGNLLAGTADVSIYSPTTTALSILAPPIPAEGEVDACVISTNSGVPAPMSQDTQVLLSSRNTQILDVDDSVLIPKSSYYTIIRMRGMTPGDVSVTAQGNGLPSITTNLKVVEVKASVLKVSYISPITLIDFPIVIQTVSTLGGPIVCDSPITVHMTSSNTSAVNIPETATVPRESSDLLIYGKSPQEGLSSITFNSGGFTSLTLNIKSLALSWGLKILSVDAGSIGSRLKVTAAASFNDKPLIGATIHWRGADIYVNSSTTDELGQATNFIKLMNPQNIVEAEVEMPGIGVVSVSKQIVGKKLVNVNVNSSIGVTIEGSGSYIEGERIELKAPSSIDLQGVLNLLGIRYTFKEWKNGPVSNNSTATFIVPSSLEEVNIEAIYDTDYTGLIIRIGVVALASVAIFIAVTIMRRRA